MEEPKITVSRDIFPYEREISNLEKSRPNCPIAALVIQGYKNWAKFQLGEMGEGKHNVELNNIAIFIKAHIEMNKIEDKNKKTLTITTNKIKT